MYYKVNHKPHSAENERSNPYTAQPGLGGPYGEEQYNIFDSVVTLGLGSVVVHVDPEVQAPSRERDDRGELYENAHSDPAFSPVVFTCKRPGFEYEAGQRKRGMTEHSPIGEAPVPRKYRICRIKMAWKSDSWP